MVAVKSNSVLTPSLDHTGDVIFCMASLCTLMSLCIVGLVCSFSVCVAAAKGEENKDAHHHAGYWRCLSG